MWLAARQGRKPLGMSFKALMGTICLSSPSLNAQYPRGQAMCAQFPALTMSFPPCLFLCEGCSAALLSELRPRHHFFLKAFDACFSPNSFSSKSLQTSSFPLHLS